MLELAALLLKLVLGLGLMLPFIMPAASFSVPLYRIDRAGLFCELEANPNWAGYEAIFGLSWVLWSKIILSEHPYLVALQEPSPAIGLLVTLSDLCRFLSLFRILASLVALVNRLDLI
jgi:hypothetical protein